MKIVLDIEDIKQANMYVSQTFEERAKAFLRSEGVHVKKPIAGSWNNSGTDFTITIMEEKEKDHQCIKKPSGVYVKYDSSIEGWHIINAINYELITRINNCPYCGYKL